MNQLRPTSSLARIHWGNIGVWTLQILLAALFAFAGAMKFLTPIEVMTQQSPFPGWFFHFIGVCEILGAFGLILPGLFRVRQELTPLAAALLVPIMLGATVLSVQAGGVGAGLLPALIALACAFVAHRRTRERPRTAAAGVA